MKTKIYEFNNQIIYKELPEMVMAYNKENGDMYEFNDIGGQILILLSKNKSLEEIIQLLAKEYNASIEEIKNDVEEIFFRMLELKIISEKSKE